MSRSPRRWTWGDPIGPLAAALERGAILGIPTESSYGLAVDPESDRGVAAVYRLKRRAASMPLPVVAADLEQIRRLGGETETAERLGLTGLWPAPLTLLLPVARELPAAAGSGRIGFRVPAHAGLRGLLRDLGRGVTATSANRSGEPPLLDASDMLRLLEGCDAVLVDGGRLPGGEPSTVVGVGEGGIEIVRRGAFPLERLEGAVRRAAEGGRFSAATVEISVDESD